MRARVPVSAPRGCRSTGDGYLRNFVDRRTQRTVVCRWLYMRHSLFIGGAWLCLSYVPYVSLTCPLRVPCPLRAPYVSLTCPSSYVPTPFLRMSLVCPLYVPCMSLRMSLVCPLYVPCMSHHFLRVPNPLGHTKHPPRARARSDRSKISKKKPQITNHTDS